MLDRIRIRDDDVLMHSSGSKDAFGRFRGVHNIICRSDKFIHVPAILVTEIQDFPDCIDYIKEETASGRMLPEIHGLEHIDYGKLTRSEVKDHLIICREFIQNKFNHSATIWYTPWGASQPHLHEVSEALGIQLVDCSGIIKFQGRYGIQRRLMDGVDIKYFYGKELFMHWWEGGSRLERVVETGVHGSWEAAAKANPKLFE